MAINPKSNAALEVSDQADYMNYLKDAPIEEFAKYAGIDINEAVDRRVAAVEAAAFIPAVEVHARPITPIGNLVGFASVTIGGIKIDDFKIVENKDGELFVGMPSRPDKNSDTGYRNTVYVNKDIREDFSKKVLSEYSSAVEKVQARSESQRSTPEKTKKRIADRVAEAEKGAQEYNAKLPKKEKTVKNRADRGE